MSNSEGSHCSSSGNCKIWCYLYGLCQLLLLTCIATALWEIMWAIYDVSDAISGK